MDLCVLKYLHKVETDLHIIQWVKKVETFCDTPSKLH